MNKLLANKRGPNKPITIWKAPLYGRVKCNIDASFPSQSNKIGIDVCIRDEKGQFILAKTKWITPQCDIHVGETLELLSAICRAPDLRLGPMDFELAF